MYFEVSKKTPILRGLFIAVLPLTTLLVYSCAEVERPVQVPALKSVIVKLRHARVLVGTATRANPLEISARKEVTVYSSDGKQILDTLSLSRAKVTFSRGKVVLGGRDLGAPAVTLAAAPNDRVTVGKISYSGYIALVARGESVAAINYVDMEDYVAGVVSCEMPDRFGAAALEAQAVAARTYALWTMTHTRLMPFDLRDDQFSQVYRGVTETRSAGRRAAARTAGVVLVYDWRFLPAYYSSTCGGYGAPPSQMRGAPRDVPPLEAVKCDYCRSSPRYRWKLSIPLEEMEKRLVEAGHVAGRLVDVRVKDTAPGGWVETVEVVSTDGAKPLTGYALRQSIGTSKLYSTNFTISRKEDKFVIEGRGFGHGVGMCQFGADGMARRGRNFAEILQHYYAGARLVKIY